MWAYYDLHTRVFCGCEVHAVSMDPQRAPATNWEADSCIFVLLTLLDLEKTTVLIINGGKRRQMQIIQPNCLVPERPRLAVSVYGGVFPPAALDSLTQTRCRKTRQTLNATLEHSTHLLSPRIMKRQSEAGRGKEAQVRGADV